VLLTFGKMQDRHALTHPPDSLVSMFSLSGIFLLLKRLSFASFQESFKFYADKLKERAAKGQATAEG